MKELMNWYEHAVHVAKYQESPGRQDFCDANEDGGAVHRCLHGIMHLIEDHAKTGRYSGTICGSKLAEGDELILEQLKLDENEKETPGAYCKADGNRNVDLTGPQQLHICVLTLLRKSVMKRL